MRHRGREVDPLLVFAPDDRRTYNDRSYPWGTICRVVTAAGTGSGVIVGPRHVLTASHVVDWSRNGAGTVEVHRAGGFVRATTAITRVWFFTKVTGTVDYFENDEDYAVLVTGQRIGDSFGWLGTRTYNSSWDGEPYWWNIGYPGDIGGGNTPTFQRNKELDEDAWDWGGGRSMTTNADTFFGNSGGPMFGFWDAGPYVVAVVSSQSSSENWCSGGDDMTRLVRHARTVDP
jgi:V8-like Glu-specific endopeptidase